MRVRARYKTAARVYAPARSGHGSDRDEVDQQFLTEIGNLAGLERLELEWPMMAEDLMPLLALESLACLTIYRPLVVLHGP